MPGSLFTLEALEAAHGDALLLHFGPASAPRLIVIDGGPSGVFESSLSPRLEEIRNQRGGGQLEIRMVMVSHIDDDHITGILALTRSLRAAAEKKAPLPYDVLTLWHNSFDDIVAGLGADVVRLLTAVGHDPNAMPAGGAVVASVAQGRDLRRDADQLAWNMNSGFNGLIHFAPPVKRLNVGAGLRFTVLGPRKAELDDLQKKWDAEVKAMLKKKKKKPGGGASLEPADLEAVAAAFVDTSVHNLSSIVVLAESGGKRILLTGDARGDLILESLAEAGLLKDGTCHVDIFKAPHHGSSRNAAPELFQKVIARHYVFSANGKYSNPDTATFDMLFGARPSGPYDLWLTNAVPFAVTHIKKHKPADVTLHVRGDADLSIRIDLADAVQ